MEGWAAHLRVRLGVRARRWSRHRVRSRPRLDSPEETAESTDGVQEPPGADEQDAAVSSLLGIPRRVE